MKLLALDTSTDNCSLALADETGVIATRSLMSAKSHTKVFFELLTEILGAAGWQLNDLTQLAFGAGPGSFTGVRLAASLVQGLASVLDVPVYPISTLQVLAEVAHQKCGATKVIVMQDARMQELYAGEYFWSLKEKIMQAVRPEQLISYEDGRIWCKPNVTVVGSGVKLLSLPGNIPIFPEICYIDSCYVAKIALWKSEHGIAPVKAEAALPIYLRDRVAQTIEERKKAVNLRT